MIHTGKCPSCTKTMHEIKMQTVTLRINFSDQYSGVSYQCPHCSAVLGAGPDFLLLQKDIARAVKAEMAKR